VLNFLRCLLFASLALFRARRQLAIEILALRHQLGVLKRSVKRPRLRNVGRGLWVLLSRRWAGWSDALQNPYVERVIGTLRRELLDHVIVLNERHLRWLLRRFIAEYYHPCRTHLSLGKDAPEPRPAEPPESGRVLELPLVGGLHHRYTRRAA
jgi:hypothetical protein